MRFSIRVCRRTSNDCSQTDSSWLITSGPMVSSFCSTCSNISVSGSSSSLINESSSLLSIYTKLRNFRLKNRHLCRMKNGRYWLDYLQHLLKANTRHGTHSPFVYRLLDEVVYPRRRAGEPRDKTERLVSRLRNRFAPNRRAADLDGAQKQRDTDFI